MKTWEIIVSIAAGILIIADLIDKFGSTSKKIKDADKYLDKLKRMPEQIENLTCEVREADKKRTLISQAIRGLIREKLYESFKLNRNIASWTDDECRVQTQLHDSYTSLGGNGEEIIWWDKKEQWEIVSEEEYRERYRLFLKNRNLQE